MVDALLERGVLEIREDALERPHGADLDGMGLPSTLEQLLADRIHELPGAEHVIVDWLAIRGRSRSVSPISPSSMRRLWTCVFRGRCARADAIMRLCARGLCDRKGDVVDFRHPLTRDVAYAYSRFDHALRMHRALGEHLAQTSLARGVSAAIVARHLVRGRRQSVRRISISKPRTPREPRTRRRSPFAITSVRSRIFRRTTPRRLGVHEALEATFRHLGLKRERVQHLEIMRATAKAIGSSRAACLALLRTARYDYDEGHLSRGLPIARQAAQLAHAHHFANFEIEAEMLVSELSRELGAVRKLSLRAIALSPPAIPR